MSRDAPIKAEKDYSEILKEEFPKIDALISQGECEQALLDLLAWEKKTRQAADLVSSKEVLGKIVDVLVGQGNWDELDEQLMLLSKKHGQLKLSIQFMIQKVMEQLDSLKDLSVKVKAIETIRTVTENKIFVEVERARVTKQLVQIRRDEGKLDEACKLLCELQVETYGSMAMYEKIQFILEQMELSILTGDFAQATVLSRKILKKTFNAEKYEALKLEYYNLLIKIGLHKRDYLEVAQYYQEIYQTQSVKSDEDKWKDALTHIAYFLVLSPYGNLQNDLIHKIQLDNNLKKLEIQESLVKLFTTQELVRWPIVQKTYEPVLNEDKIIFGCQEPEDRKYHWAELQKRVIEHNLRVVSQYYSRITLTRLNELLDLQESETETFISDLVNQGIIYAKINRPKKIVNFQKPKNSSESLNEWSNNVDELLDNIESIGHLITKEEIMHGLKS
ncbi:proteasome regulatory particle lid subunit RPN5 KNAG_0C03920 [Huiozyma naganishii CBS 8797]|uniref:PCI domain-containing protein n=1 Tax=Huiozyma naganishii (strain ATCC MYA-139 / BCRC 22969 / CBS 8797 / KCTC 17520 / NBRC 10181 / NCYC 3082 / Yp74L-3) TaxID=1071383 RepID=J7S633_HUIN7|nr:hypothetical protein KNAG_0C03920 [Kazachstania naganishii CBS 8797]CCK69496.1 hypothetical protein KNAG_0C03920 [Kazachstania naganishii CBS 8797]